jgi:ketosteroid isomerase-like protein
VSANLDLVRSIFADWERGDFGHAAEWADPRIEYVIADGPDPGEWPGLGAAAAATRGVLSTWKDYRFEVDEYRPLDDERVLVLVIRRGRGGTSGLELGQMKTKGAHVFHVRDGKVVRLVAYWDRDRALADLGLED